MRRWVELFVNPIALLDHKSRDQYLYVYLCVKGPAGGDKPIENDHLT